MLAKIKLWAAGIAAAAAWLAGIWFVAKREGKEDAEHDALQDENEALKNEIRSQAKTRDGIRSMSRVDVIKRLLEPKRER